MTAWRISPIAVELVKHFEGLHLEAYHDPVGFPTIGYGHLLSREKGADLKQWAPIDQGEADALLVKDLIRAERAINRLIEVPLTEGMRAALLDFVFNLGGGALQASTLRRVINRGDYDQAPEQLARWIYAGGRIFKGLVRRRAAEIEAWETD